MDNLAFDIWLSVGAFLVLIEFLLPGLVMVFVGLGALTVALGMHLGHINSIIDQLTVFFVSSLLYLVTLRFVVLKLVPTSSVVANIDEDKDVVGQVVKVVSAIGPSKTGRVEHSDSTWPAIAVEGQEFEVGEEVIIVGRDNITWIVQKIED